MTIQEGSSSIGASISWGEDYINPISALSKKCLDAAVIPLLATAEVVMSIMSIGSKMLDQLPAPIGFCVKSCALNPFAATYLIKQFQAGMPLTSLALRAGIISLNTLAVLGVGLVASMSIASTGCHVGKLSGQQKLNITAAATLAGVAALPAYWLFKS